MCHSGYLLPLLSCLFSTTCIYESGIHNGLHLLLILKRRRFQMCKESGKIDTWRSWQVAKVWDTMMSALVGSNPQAFLDLVLPGSSFMKHHRNKLGISERQPDAIIQAWHPIDKEFLFNPEFQTYKEGYIPERLLLYNVLLRWQYKLPVRSEVIYLTRNEQIEQPPFCWPTPGKRTKEQSQF